MANYYDYTPGSIVSFPNKNSYFLVVRYGFAKPDTYGVVWLTNGLFIPHKGFGKYGLDPTKAKLIARNLDSLYYDEDYLDDEAEALAEFNRAFYE